MAEYLNGHYDDSDVEIHREFKTYIKNIKAPYRVLATVELQSPNTLTGKKLTEGWVNRASHQGPR